MSLGCPNCQSENTQLLSIAYSSGMTTGEAITHTRGTFSIADSHKHKTVSVNQSDLSRQAAPPEKLSVFQPIKVAFITLIVFALFLSLVAPKESNFLASILQIGVFIIYLGILGFGFKKAYSNYQFNKSEWPNLLQQWQQQYLCMRCGAVFNPNGDGQTATS